MLCFSNAGEIDPRLIQTFGVNVKTNDNPIGFFGTGLKYALAVSLRLGCSIKIWSGLRCYELATTTETIRGKDFEMVTMTGPNGPVLLPFTLDLGKNWEAWMAYREFYCNMLDEHGILSTTMPDPSPGHTHIIVYGLDDAHANRREFLLVDRIEYQTLPGLEIYLGQSYALFYRGVKVAHFSKPCMFTYNVTGNMTLTEDRTASESMAKAQLAARLVSLRDESAIKTLLGMSEKHLEWDLDWQYQRVSTESVFIQTLCNHAKTRLGSISPNMHKLLTDRIPELIAPTPLTLTFVEQTMLNKAMQFCARLRHPISAPIHIVSDLGNGLLGAVLNNKIYITRECLSMGTKMLAGTLLEEHLHLTKSFSDCSREFQNYLLNLVVSLQEELDGEPL